MSYQVYILHFHTAYWSHARHYVGYTSKGVDCRVDEHRNHRGSLLVSYAINHGHEFSVTRVETFGDRQSARRREIQLKRDGHLSRHCDLCKLDNKALGKGVSA